ncbi:MAG: VOC family protein [Promethearchaeota archaeon]
MEKSKGIDLGNLKINHICYIYKDVEKQAKIMESLFNMPKFVFSEDLNHPAKFRGRDIKFSIKLGMSRCFNMQIELFQWIAGDCIYKEFVDTKREGMHHYGVFINNFQKYIDEFQKHGIEPIQSGMFPPSLKYAYMDTEKTFGTIIEFMEIIKRGRRK